MRGGRRLVEQPACQSRAISQDGSRQSPPKTTKHYDRTGDIINLDDGERFGISLPNEESVYRRGRRAGPSLFLEIVPTPIARPGSSPHVTAIVFKSR